jgi:hypothetical protein
VITVTTVSGAGDCGDAFDRGLGSLGIRVVGEKDLPIVLAAARRGQRVDEAPDIVVEVVAVRANEPEALIAEGVGPELATDLGQPFLLNGGHQPTCVGLFDPLSNSLSVVEGGNKSTLNLATRVE